ncbi:dihydroneopterin aldolase [Chloroflexi bacterium TSY]|nr:dihydroneopterin aldolase [Chloroflexi bacterium TSY]
MQDKIIIRDLVVRGILGVNPDERVNKQDIWVNVIMYTDITRAALTENLDETINYSAVSKRIIQHIEEGSDLLIEKLVTDLAKLILTEFKIAKVMVRVEKPTAARFGRSVGVEIERTRDDFPLTHHVQRAIPPK